LQFAHYGKQRQEGQSMRLDLEFHEASPLTNATAYIVVSDFDPSPDGLPCLAEDCVSMVELEEKLQHLEGHIAKIRAEAKQRFLKAGVSN
jgi:hypothetical protein